MTQPANTPLELSRFAPAIFIGLGGSGTRIVTAIRRKVQAKFREESPTDYHKIVDSIFQFVVVDSDNLGADVFDFPVNNYVPVGNFDGALLVRTLKKDSDRSKKFNEWWYPFYQSTYMGTGCAFRLNGRLALYNNLLGRPTIADLLQRLCAKAKDIFQSKVEDNVPINIYLFSSLCGGTGAGMFIDLAFYLRHQLESNFRVNIDAYLLTAEVLKLAVPAVEDDLIYAKSHTSLQELDFWQHPRRGVGYSWGFGGDGVEYPESVTPFTRVHIIDRFNDDGRVITNFDVINRLVADAVFYGAVQDRTAHAKAGAIFNVDAEGSVLFKDRPITYGSVGVATLCYPMQKVVTYIAMGLLDDILREWVMEEPKEAAGKEAQDFMQDKSGIEPTRLKAAVKKDPAYPRRPSQYVAAIPAASGKTLPGVIKGVRAAIAQYEENLRAFMGSAGQPGGAGKKAEILRRFAAALDSWIEEALGRGFKGGVGLLAQAAERIEKAIEGAGDAQDKALAAARAAELKAREMFDAAARNAEAAGVWGASSRKAELVSAVSLLLQHIEERVLLEETRPVFSECMRRVHGLREMIHAVRSGIVHASFAQLEKDRAAIWGDRNYNDEMGGIVEELIGKEQADQAASAFKGNKDAMEHFRNEIGVLVSQRASELIRAFWAASHGDSQRDPRVEAQKRTAFHDEILNEARKAVQTYGRLPASVFAAMEDLALAAAGDDKARATSLMRQWIMEFRAKVSPWWAIRDQRLKAAGLYAGIVKYIPVLVCNAQALAAFEASSGIGDVAAVLQEQAGASGVVDSRDLWRLHLVMFKYGAPLYLWDAIKQYRTHFNQYRKLKAGNPLYSDYRFESGVFRLRDFEPGREIALLRKLVFILSEIVTLPGEPGPRIQVTGGRTYNFVLPVAHGRAPIDIQGRDKAQEAWMSDNWRDNQPRFELFLEDLATYWHNLDTAERQKILHDCLDYLGKWINRIGAAAAGPERVLLDLLTEDHAAVKAALGGGSLELV